jgi:hypothetical protein
VIFSKCDSRAKRNRHLLHVEVLRGETVGFPAFGALAFFVLGAGRTRAVKLLELYLAGFRFRAPSA